MKGTKRNIRNRRIRLKKEIVIKRKVKVENENNQK